MWKFVKDFIVPKKKPKQQPRLHPNGVPIGMYPGDEVPPENAYAIWEFVQRAAQEGERQRVEREEAGGDG